MYFFFSPSSVIGIDQSADIKSKEVEYKALKSFQRRNKGKREDICFLFFLVCSVVESQNKIWFNHPFWWPLELVSYMD